MMEKSNYFEANLRKANNVLKVIGLQTDDADIDRSFFVRLKNRWYYCFFNFMLYLEFVGLIFGFINGVNEGSSITELTYTAPCITLCLVGAVKTYYNIKYAHHINDLVISLKILHLDTHSQVKSNTKLYKQIRNLEKTLRIAINCLVAINVIGLIIFLIGPIFLIWFEYLIKGELNLRFPYSIWYPFNERDLRIYPWVYIHQSIEGTFTVFTVVAPDCLFYFFCTYIQIKLCVLKFNAEKIIPNYNLQFQNTNEGIRVKTIELVSQHQQLIRCVDLVEIIYCKSTLFNFVTSSFLICLAGFNIVAHEDIGMLANYLSFLAMSMLQIYLYCYFGDNVSRTSVELGDGVYNSKWFNINVTTAKDLTIILKRAQKPCKLTAYGFADINLSAFTRILSSSWSYFALLQSMYNRN